MQVIPLCMLMVAILAMHPAIAETLPEPQEYFWANEEIESLVIPHIPRGDSISYVLRFAEQINLCLGLPESASTGETNARIAELARMARAKEVGLDPSTSWDAIVAHVGRPLRKKAGGLEQGLIGRREAYEQFFRELWLDRLGLPGTATRWETSVRLGELVRKQRVEDLTLRNSMSWVDICQAAMK